MKYNSLSIRLIAPSFPHLNANARWYINGHHTGVRLAIHSKDVLDCLEHTDGCLLEITTENASSNYLMTREVKSTLEVSGTVWPALRNNILSMAHVIQLAVGVLMSSLGVTGCSKSREAHEPNTQCGEIASINTGKSQRLRKEGNAPINMLLAMRPGFANIIQNVHISGQFESPESGLYIAENAHCIDCADTWSSKLVNLLSKRQSLDRGTTYYRCDDKLELDTGVAWRSIPITGIHPPVAPMLKI